MVWFLKKPPRAATRKTATPLQQAQAIGKCFGGRVLLWIFVFAMLAIVLEDVPYIFLQPYIEQTLNRFQLNHSAPLAAGLVIGAIMGLPAIASRLSVATLRVFGTVKTLLASMLLQVLLVTAMAWVIHPGVAVLLVLRMIATALSYPVLMATVQPRLNNESRATYLSFQNLSGRALLSGSIMLGTWAVGDTQTLDANALGKLIPYYAVGGWLALLALRLTARQCNLFVKR